jgi:hypothetical protein
MKQFKIKASTTAVAVFASMIAASPAAANGDGSDGYEVWGSDQSNSVAGIASPGVSGSFMWIWDSKDMDKQLKTGKPAEPLGCDGKNRAGDGPCNVYDVFPSGLAEYDAAGATGKTLGELPAFGRLHGMLPDPQNRYMNVNLFAPNGGYVGIVDGESKAAVALFRVTGTNAGRSVHMSFWNSDGSALLVANLNGKVLERIDITRNPGGKITAATFRQDASLGVGKGMSISDSARVYLGVNGQGENMLGTVAGTYDSGAFGDLTPNGECKENDCASGPDAAMGGRANNVIICPIVSDHDNAYVTFGGGGLLVADITATPMQIVGEYGNNVINGAGCGGVQVGDVMWLNAGVSASGAGATQSTFTMYTIDDAGFGNSANAPNTPWPTMVYKDPSNTSTIGNTDGSAPTNTTGQLPGITTRRDAHGMARTLSGSHIHNVDRIQNTVEVFDTTTLANTTYDLTSADGQGNGAGACAAASVTDDAGLPGNDPAPDLMDTTPDGKYLVVALRGPVPVSVTHSAQGSCPGVGIIEVLDGGASGRLAGVLRTTNTVDTAPGSAPGGHAYTGIEHSDVHGAAVRRK